MTRCRAASGSASRSAARSPSTRSLLLLDEPMSNLDYKVRLELRHELRALQQRIGITAIYVTHDREEALTLADRIAVIDAGRIVAVRHAGGGLPPAGDARSSPASWARTTRSMLIERADGTLASPATVGRPGAPVRAHFRGDAARLAPAASADDPADTLMLPGIVEQALYVGQGYRYRVRTGDAQVWVHAPERLAEGTSARVVVPRAALLLFPRELQPRSTLGDPQEDPMRFRPSTRRSPLAAAFAAALPLPAQRRRSTSSPPATRTWSTTSTTTSARSSRR